MYSHAGGSYTRRFALTSDPQQIQELIRQRLADRVSRQEIIFELERLGLSRAEAAEQIDKSQVTNFSIKVNGQPLEPEPEPQGAREYREDSYEKPFYKQPRVLIGIATTLVVLGFYGFRFFGGPTDEELIKDLNEAAVANERTDGSIGKTNFLNLRTGDCLDESFNEQIGSNDTRSVTRVVCDSNAEFVVASQELMPDSSRASYPSLTYFENFAADTCSDNVVILLYPSEDTWELGDRVVTCIDTW